MFQILFKEFEGGFFKDNIYFAAYKENRENSLHHPIFRNWALNDKPGGHGFDSHGGETRLFKSRTETRA